MRVYQKTLLTLSFLQKSAVTLLVCSLLLSPYALSQVKTTEPPQASEQQDDSSQQEDSSNNESEDDTFVPSEEISEDLGVSYPVDI